MPTEINGYHVFQLQCAVKDLAETIQVTELENDLSDGYYAQLLLGSNTGLRRWKITMPSLDSGTRTATGINGETLTWEEYIWDLFLESKISGAPFAYQSLHNNQYYLVRFADPSLTYERLFVQLYSTGVELKQVRIKDAWVFENTEIRNIWDVYDENSWSSGFPTGWQGLIDAANIFQPTGDVDQTGTQNGLPTIQFNVSSNNGLLNLAVGPTLKEFWLVMKMREATFSNAAGIITGDGAADPQVLIGSSGTTKFANPSLTGYTYELNGVEYEQSNLQAPMNAWGIVHVRYPIGWTLSGGVQLGKNRTTAGTFAEMDVAEFIPSANLLPRHVKREIDEYLVTKWR